MMTIHGFRMTIPQSMQGLTLVSTLYDEAPLLLLTGFAAATSVLGVANLAVGFLNLGLTGYNTYKLRGISKLQKVVQGQ